MLNVAIFHISVALKINFNILKALEKLKFPDKVTFKGSEPS